MKYELSIVIPVHNNFNFTKACVDDLLMLPKNHEIIIVDNGSTDNTKKMQAHDSRVRILRNKSNLGFAKAVNIGFSMSDGDNVMFLNNDIRVRSEKETWTKSIIESASDGLIVGPTVGVLDNNFNFITEANKMPSKGYSYMSGWNLTASVNTWNKLILEKEDGPFNSINFFSYFEDTDLSFRAKELGIPFKIIDCPVHHFGRMTGKKLNLPIMYEKSKNKFVEIWKERVVMGNVL